MRLPCSKNIVLSCLLLDCYDDDDDDEEEDDDDDDDEGGGVLVVVGPVSASVPASMFLVSSLLVVGVTVGCDDPVVFGKNWVGDRLRSDVDSCLYSFWKVVVIAVVERAAEEDEVVVVRVGVGTVDCP